MTRHARLATLLTLTLLLPATLPAARRRPPRREEVAGDDHARPGWWCFGAGSFLAARRHGIDALRLEYRTPKRFVAGSRLLGGITTGPQDFVLGYAGFYWELPLGRKLVFSPGTAVGLLSGGDRERFSGPLQFRTSLELHWELGEDQRLGLALQHVSNAERRHPNRGSNTQLLVWSVAFGPRGHRGGHRARPGLSPPPP